VSLLSRLTRGRRESLLFISPVVPALSGNGLAMRAAHTAIAFATRYRVTLLVLPLYASPSGRAVPEPVRQVCTQALIVGDGEPPPSPADAFDVVHVFRLGTVAPAEAILRRFATHARLWLDLDDVESIVHRRLAADHRAHGDDAAAGEELARSLEAEDREVAALQRFERVFLASARDIDGLPLQGAAEAIPLPNVLPLPDLLPEPESSGPATILFVGTLGYRPNVAGALWFAREVLPLIRRAVARPVTFRVVGMGWLPEAEALQGLPGVELIGAVPDVVPHYSAANLVVVPLHAGGGTRIKVIEAFGLGRPVVATPIGAEGIDANDGEHLLIEPDAERVAGACARLLDDARMRAELVRNARRLAQERYTPDALAAIVANLP
jgi:glycosyltransferase involved in cell wall biosynthesis